LLAEALVALQAMPRSSGHCLAYTRQALAKVRLSLPAPMADPDNTAEANFKVLDNNPGAFGWRSVGLDDASAVKLVYFDNVAALKDPPRYAGHIGLFSSGVIYSDANYQITKWWRSHFAGAFVPLSASPRLIVVRVGGPTPAIDGNTYQQIPSTWNPDLSTCIVQTSALQTFLQTNVPSLAPQMPIRAALTALGLANVSFNLTHIQDPVDPRIYVFT